MVSKLETNGISKPAPIDFKEVGASTINLFSYNDEITPSPVVSVDDLDRMLDIDGQISALYNVVTSPIIGTPLRVIAKDKKSLGEAEFIRKVLFNPYSDGGMITPFTYVLSTISRMILEGFSPHELVWRYDEDEQKILLSKIAYRPAKYVAVKIDEHGDFIEFRQTSSSFSGGESKIISKDKALWFVVRKEFNNVYGKSLFNAAYYHYEKKHKLYYISHIAAQISATGLRSVTGPSSDNDNPNNRQKIVQEVAKLGFNSTVFLPDPYKLEIHNLPVAMNFMLLINHHDIMMSKSVLAEFIDLGVNSESGSFNLSATQSDVFIDKLLQIMNYIVSVFNTDLIPKLIDFNFKSKKYPKLMYNPISKATAQLVKDAFIRIASSRAINVSPDFMKALEEEVAKKLGFEIDYNNVEFPDQRMLVKDKRFDEGVGEVDNKEDN